MQNLYNKAYNDGYGDGMKAQKEKMSMAKDCYKAVAGEADMLVAENESLKEQLENMMAVVARVEKQRNEALEKLDKILKPPSEYQGEY